MAYEFYFQHAATFTVEVIQIKRQWTKDRKGFENSKRVPLGTVTLTDVELAGLDRLFKFYRSKMDRMTTNTDRITAVLKSGGTVKATESFIDSTAATYDMKDLTLLSSIPARLKVPAE